MQQDPDGPGDSGLSLIVCGITLSTGVSCLCLLRVQTTQDFAGINFAAAKIVLMSNLLVRVCLFMRELFYLKNWNFTGLSTALKRSFSFNILSYSIFLLLVAGCFTAPMLHTFDPVPLAFSICSFCLISFLMKWHQCPAWEAYIMSEMNGLDYGSGMAHSFYHGYLRVILPTKGDNSYGFRERIELYMADNGLDDESFPVKKLIILVPSSGFTFPKLCDDPSLPGDRIIEPAKILEDHMQDRAGTVKRVYKGGAYRITVKTDTKPFFLYTIAEGATPLLTFREAYSSRSGAHLQQHKEEIVRNFYKTLQKLLDEDIECKNLVDLLYYNDEDHNNPHDAVGILKNHLLEKRSLL